MDSVMLGVGLANQNIALAFVAGSVVVAFGAVFGIAKAFDSYQAAGQAATQVAKTRQVVVASRTLYPGVEITPDDVFVATLPVEYSPAITDATTSKPKEAPLFDTPERVVGQLPREKILKGELLRPERLADGSVGLGLSVFIPRGMRAISLNLKGADAITGFLTPGSYVDVLVSMEDEAGVIRTEPLLQAVPVIGVNSKAENESEADVSSRGKQKPSVTFLVTAEQAEDLAFANELGEVSLALRNVQDVAYTDLRAADINRVLSRVLRPVVTAPVVVEPVARVSRPAAAAAAAPAPDAGPTVTVIRGSVRADVGVNDLENGTLPGGPDEGNKRRR